MNSKEHRRSVQDFIIKKAKADPMITDAAIIGSESMGEHDAWSDIDLSFGFAAGVSTERLLMQWTKTMKDEFDASVLFDLNYGHAVYRVFLLPSALQVDLSFSPSEKFGPITEKFTLLFGKAKKIAQKSSPDHNDIFGYATLFALKTRTSIERKKNWQAFYYLNHLRDKVLTLICLKHQLDPYDARGFDLIPRDILGSVEESIPLTLEEQDLKNALVSLVRVLRFQIKDVDAINDKLTDELDLIAGI